MLYLTRVNCPAASPTHGVALPGAALLLLLLAGCAKPTSDAQDPAAPSSPQTSAPIAPVTLASTPEIDQTLTNHVVEHHPPAPLPPTDSSPAVELFSLPAATDSVPKAVRWPVPRPDLFSPPQTDSPPATAGDPQPESLPPVSEVVLNGFARVDEPRVVLTIGDQTLPLQVGQERNGVRIVAIEPPEVTLERDGSQWTLSLKRTE